MIETPGRRGVPWIGSFLISSSMLLPAASAATKPDVCSVITSAEIEAVQGERVSHTKSSGQQCFYTVVPFARSVSLELARSEPRGPAAEGPRDRWNDMFHPETRAKDGEGPEGRAGKETEAESGRPIPVKDLGDEAFWNGNAITGGLYVLKGDAWIRISLGGPEDSSVKIERASRLARKAMPRL